MNKRKSYVIRKVDAHPVHSIEYDWVAMELDAKNNAWKTYLVRALIIFGWIVYLGIFALGVDVAIFYQEYFGAFRLLCLGALGLIVLYLVSKVIWEAY